MNTDTTPPAQAAPPVYEPFAVRSRVFRLDSVLEGESDWALARLALNERSFAMYHDDHRAEEARRIAKLFTFAEAGRADAFLAAGIQDADRLEALATAETLTDEDRTWLLDQLRLAWSRLDSARDAIDNSGSMMTTTYAASSIDYVRWSRRPEAYTGIDPRRATRQSEAS